MSQIEILEQFILCRRIITDLDDLLEEVLEGDPTPDQVSNVIIGVQQLARIRFDKLELMITAKYTDGYSSKYHYTNEPV